MGLRVVARRKPGFTAPIAISLPWNPPGVSSSGGVSIPEKADEAVDPHERRRRRRAEDLAGGRQRHRRHARAAR